MVASARLLKTLSLVTVVAMLSAQSAWAKSFPIRPVRVLIPTTAGATSDILARAIARRLTEHWGEQVVVDNRPGGHGIIAMETLAKATPDGHTLMMGNIGVIAINAGLYPKLPYDTVRDFSPITQTTRQPFVLGVSPSLPAKNIQDFIVLAKSRPGQFNYGSAGNGSGTHVSMEMLKRQTGINIVHVPYKGGALVVNDLIAGHVQAYMSGVFVLLPHIKTGKIKGLAMTHDKRLAILPAMPTFVEAGLKDFVISQWQGMLAPAKITPALVTKLHADVKNAMKAPEIQDRMTAEGVEIVNSSPKEFDQFIRSEIVRWSMVIKEAGIRID